eukprot:GHUV01033613.1.p1 GENE.GHUV01033613.1~~GHUV01033613.1.p1  ORF type:complete len:255 (+),score=41.16 GHUV01033613.1:296-1060(+)
MRLAGNYTVMLPGCSGSSNIATYWCNDCCCDQPGTCKSIRSFIATSTLVMMLLLSYCCLLQEMLSQSLEEPPSSSKGRLASATKAVAFYSTPHFGSSMAALGWKLRHLPGASPAPSIHHLSPGPHLAALNARLALLHESGRVQVLSFTEGLATSLAGLGFLPKILIVPYESAYPGFGEVHVLADRDHIDVCKPEGKGAPAYSKLLEFITANMANSITGSSSGEAAAGESRQAAAAACGGAAAATAEDLVMVSSA